MSDKEVVVERMDKITSVANTRSITDLLLLASSEAMYLRSILTDGEEPIQQDQSRRFQAVGSSYMLQELGRIGKNLPLPPQSQIFREDIEFICDMCSFFGFTFETYFLENGNEEFNADWNSLENIVERSEVIKTATERVVDALWLVSQRTGD